MKTALGHILCLIFLFSLTYSLHGQSKMDTKPDTDERLTRYELLCKECLDMKYLVSEGKRISRAYASGMIADFVAMNREIKADSASLSPLQQRRFEMINHWFSTGNRPMAMDHVQMDRIQPELAGKAVCMNSRQEDVALRILSYTPVPENDNINDVDDTVTELFGETQNKGMSFYVMAGFSLPVSYGVMAGLKKSGKGIDWGGYTRFRSNFRFTESSYSCFSSGTIDNGYAFMGNGKSRKTDLMVTAGVIAGLAPWLDIYAGAGYGQKILLWQDIDGSWACVSDFTHKGMALEAGLITSWRRLCLGIGISTVNFRTASLDLSVGMRF